MIILTEQKQNKNVVYTTLKPLINLRVVDSIFVVRDEPGYDMEKVTYICPNRFLLKFRFLRALSKLYLMIKITKVKRPDLLIGIDMVPHTLHAIICSRLFHIPVVGSMRGMPETYFKGIERPFMPFILRNIDILTTTGIRSREWMANKLPIDKIYILPNSIDTNKFNFKKKSRKYDIINIGRLHKSKNIDIFLKVIYEVRKEIPQLKVAIIGDGPEEERLKLLSQKLALENVVDFLGFKNHPEKYYLISKIFLLPTSREGLPMALIEAMCCGCVPVVSKVGDIPDVCINNKNSILIEDFLNISNFKNSVVELLSNENIWYTLSNNAIKIKKRFNFRLAENLWSNIFINIS